MPSFAPVTAALRALEVLRAVNVKREATVTDIFKATGINRPTIVRMLETLAHAGYVLRHLDRPVYSPTGKTLELSGGYELHSEVGRIAGPILAELRRLTRWPSDVAVFDGDAMVVVQTSRDQDRIFMNRRPGFRAPILGTSLGRAYIAFCSDEDRSRALALAAKSSDLWDRPAHEPRQAAQLIRRIRQSGFATMHEEYSRRAYESSADSIGVPVLIGGVAACAMNLMYLREAMSAREAEQRYLGPLRETAARLAAALAKVRPN